MQSQLADVCLKAASALTSLILYHVKCCDFSYHFMISLQLHLHDESRIVWNVKYAQPKTYAADTKADASSNHKITNSGHTCMPYADCFGAMHLTQHVHDTGPPWSMHSSSQCILASGLATPQSHLHVQPTWQDGSELQLC